MKTDNKSLDLWLRFYAGKKSHNQFISYLKKLDKTFLSYEQGFDSTQEVFDLIPRRGFLEKDFLEIRKGLDKDGIHNIEEKTRLVLAMALGVDFKQWLEVYKDSLGLVFAKALIDGNYEEYGFELEKIISIALKEELIERDDFFGVAIIRGNVLSQRYPDENSLLLLNKKVTENKRKVLLQSLLTWL